MQGIVTRDMHRRRTAKPDACSQVMLSNPDITVTVVRNPQGRAFALRRRQGKGRPGIIKARGPNPAANAVMTLVQVPRTVSRRGPDVLHKWPALPGPWPLWRL